MEDNELIDIYDGNFNFIGVRDRNSAHALGLWHQTVHCWIVRKKEGRKYILFQKRAANKKDSPGLFDITVAGHLLAGEGKEQIIREIKEEIGIIAELTDLIYLGFLININCDFMNKEFCHVYLFEDNTELMQYHILNSEVECMLELQINDTIKLFQGEINRAIGKIAKEKQIHNVYVHEFEFIKRRDFYYEKICNIACAFLDGQNAKFEESVSNVFFSVDSEPCRTSVGTGICEWR